MKHFSSKLSFTDSGITKEWQSRVEGGEGKEKDGGKKGEDKEEKEEDNGEERRCRMEGKKMSMKER